jgi:hypothetical protein
MTLRDIGIAAIGIMLDGFDRLNKRVVAIAAAMVLILACVLWAVTRSRPDPQVAKVEQMQAELGDESATPEQRRERFQQLRQEVEKLAPQQREQMFARFMQQRDAELQKKVAEYFKLSKQDRLAYLDKEIARMDEFRGGGRPRSAKSSGKNGGGGGSGGRGAPDADAKSGPPPGNGPPPGGGGPGGWRGLNASQRSQAKRARLDQSTPEERGQRTAYFKDMTQRRAELGLPTPPPGHGAGFF